MWAPIETATRRDFFVRSSGHVMGGRTACNWLWHRTPRVVGDHARQFLSGPSDPVTRERNPHGIGAREHQLDLLLATFQGPRVSTPKHTRHQFGLFHHPPRTKGAGLPEMADHPRRCRTAHLHTMSTTALFLQVQSSTMSDPHILPCALQSQAKGTHFQRIPLDGIHVGGLATDRHASFVSLHRHTTKLDPVDPTASMADPVWGRLLVPTSSSNQGQSHPRANDFTTRIEKMLRHTAHGTRATAPHLRQARGTKIHTLGAQCATMLEES